MAKVIETQLSSSVSQSDSHHSVHLKLWDILCLILPKSWIERIFWFEWRNATVKGNYTMYPVLLKQSGLNNCWPHHYTECYQLVSTPSYTSGTFKTSKDPIGLYLQYIEQYRHSFIQWRGFEKTHLVEAVPSMIQQLCLTRYQEHHSGGFAPWSLG